MVGSVRVGQATRQMVADSSGPGIRNRLAPLGSIPGISTKFFLQSKILERGMGEKDDTSINTSYTATSR